MNDNGISSLEIGSQVFLPPHGVASVKGMEEHAFGSQSQTFYVLSLARGERLLIPVDNLEKAGVRELVSPGIARKLLEQVTSEPTTETPSYWRERAANYADGLKTGEADRYTEILQQLLFRSRAEKLSATDQKALEVARGYFVAEIAAVLNRPAQAIEEALRQESSE